MLYPESLKFAFTDFSIGLNCFQMIIAAYSLTIPGINQFMQL